MLLVLAYQPGHRQTYIMSRTLQNNPTYYLEHGLDWITCIIDSDAVKTATAMCIIH